MKKHIIAVFAALILACGVLVGAAAWPLVQVGAASRAEAPAVVPAEEMLRKVQ